MQPRTFRMALAAMLAAHLLVLGLLATVLPVTTDEPNYLRAGALVAQERSWADFATRLHGPLPFLAGQLFTGVPADVAVACCTAPGNAPPPAVVLARLGLLPFALLAALVLVHLAHRAFGARAALAALALHALNPVVLANAPLLTCDMALCATSLLVVAVAWRWCEQPGWKWLLPLGAALGMALATKYLALLLLPVLAIALVLFVLRGGAPRSWLTRSTSGAGPGTSARAIDALLAALVVAAVALLALHACYSFAAPRFDAAATPPASAALQRALSWRGVAALASLLPEPFVRGADFQKLQSECGGAIHFAGTIGGIHAGYFPTALAVKLPLAWLAVLLLGLSQRHPRWPRHLATLVTAAVVVPIGYLTFCSVLKGGIRYVLPVLPLLALIGGRAIELVPSTTTPAARAGRAAACLLALALVANVVLSWPRFTSSFNLLAAERPWMLFTDSTLAWPGDDVRCDDHARLEARHGPLPRVYENCGPRFGKVVAFGLDLAPPDPRPGRVWHWLRRFAPSDRLGAFFVFELDEAAFRRAIDAAATPAEEQRATVELAIALLGAGRAAAAAAAVDGSADPAAETVRRAAARMRASDGSGLRDPALGALLLQLGRHDLVADAEALPLLLRARAWVALRQYVRASEALAAAAARRPLHVQEELVLAHALVSLHRTEAALATLERALVAAGPSRPGLEQLCEELRRRTAMATAR